MELPMEVLSGTLTFLFTDVEGSTRLWDYHAEAMSAALARHDALIREAVEIHKGQVFKTMGDAFHASFADANSALGAALDFQKKLQAEPILADDAKLMVRAAVHSGTAGRRDNDYFGPTLNRTARLLSAAHGEQTLVSSTTRALLDSALPEGASLRELGEHRLRDLRSDTIYQLVHPSIRSEFPPILSLGASELPNNLPEQLTSFVGREEPLGELQELLSRNRLLTITGSGGAGKSRLMLQFAADTLPDFPNGVWLTELAPLSDSALVPSAIATSLSLREEPGRPLLATITDYLKDRTVLILVDNCEHVLDEAARVVDTILRACPKVKIVATSREALGVGGEQSYRIPSLALPPTGAMPTVSELETCESVRLFLDRAMLAQPAFRLTPTNSEPIARICRRLDGIPLAIELAAARTRALAPDQIASRLDDRFRLLTGGSRTALPRQQTLRAMIDWSYDLLSPKEQALLQRLSVFAGGWTLESAEKVCADEPA
jgi:class 3 adenylate cyclase